MGSDRLPQNNAAFKKLQFIFKLINNIGLLCSSIKFFNILQLNFSEGIRSLKSIETFGLSVCNKMLCIVN